MCCVLLEITILCMCRIISFKLNYVCVQLFVLLHTYVTNVSLICLLAKYLWYFMYKFFCFIAILVVVMSQN
jgi:hypothetical protein